MSTLCRCVDASSIENWRRQIGRQRYGRNRRGPRPFAAIAWFARGAIVDGLIELRRLQFWVLHDQHYSGNRLRHRLACYRAAPIEWGVLLGGEDQMRFEKDLALSPDYLPPRSRIAPGNGKLLRQALQLDGYLELHSKFPYYPRKCSPKLPRFLAALKIDSPIADGPELPACFEQSGLDSRTASEQLLRLHRGQWLHPIELVSHSSNELNAVYADMSGVPKRQVVRLDSEESLNGFRGTVQYDFLSSRFGRQST